MSWIHAGRTFNICATKLFHRRAMANALVVLAGSTYHPMKGGTPEEEGDCPHLRSTVSQLRPQAGMNYNLTSTARTHKAICSMYVQ